jgi:hypothetical protein
VQIGPGVTINTSPKRPIIEISEPADYNARAFDPVAYVGKAQAIARKLAADAHLTSFYFSGVHADGHVELGGGKHEYRFRSSAATQKAPIVDGDDKVWGGMIYVDIGATKVSARVIYTDDCDAKLVRSPSCKLASVWKQAVGAGLAAGRTVEIVWLFDEKWYFNDANSESFPDRCP